MHLHYFNPRVPCGTRPRKPVISMVNMKFQSTRPMRDATILHLEPMLNHLISIHASHAGRDLMCLLLFQHHLISIHASHAGRDQAIAERQQQAIKISIHASHAGRDLLCILSSHSVNISIHASHAGRDPAFQSFHR